MDSLFQSKFETEGGFEDLIINLEHQSSHVSSDKLKDINMYSVLASYFLACPAVSIVLTDFKSYKKSMKEYKADEDLILKPRYIYFTNYEIDEKISNLKAKHDLNKNLSDMEAMDLAFLPIMVPKHMRKNIVRTLVNLFNGLKIKNETLIALISHVLNLMLKYLFKGDELIELKGMIKMGFKESSDRLLDARINEFNELSDKLLESEKKLNKSEEDLKIANKERDKALSKTNQFIEAFKNLKKQGKITDKDLFLAGIIL